MDRRVITYSRNVFIPLTQVCHNRCGYCTFRQEVSQDALLTPTEVSRILFLGKEAGCTEVLLTFGERPEKEAGFLTLLGGIGYESILDYCYDVCLQAIETGILPHTNAGILFPDEMKRLAPVNASMGLMLETTADIPAHALSPGKQPEVRIEMIAEAGRQKIPFTTGLLLGIGESKEDRRDSLQVIADLHSRYHHIQEVIIQNFCPHEGTGMEQMPPADAQSIIDTVELAVTILPPDIAIQIPPNLIDAERVIPHGVSDLGGISPVTIDYVNPQHPWPRLEELRSRIGEAELKERLCIYPRYIEKGWYSEQLGDLIWKYAREIYHMERDNV
ncbi:MAG: 7,8-didemethyl-8-hydroxy-5-deazariboflavin synthase subunit CofG [Methanospirillaceae archaeon]|nr:7,8-didemethyl-8-hydroxy-5-deazariboflavin synthase subunit CofG [Methanospirillaceae archaeon]